MAHLARPASTSEWLVILEELKKSLLLNNTFFGEASDAVSCIPMI
jgi:hypothetical protein